MPLALQHIRAAADDEIVGGDFVCAGCGARYPVRDGIADFLGPPRPLSEADVLSPGFTSVAGGRSH